MRLAFHKALVQEFEKSDETAAVHFVSPFPIHTHTCLKRCLLLPLSGRMLTGSCETDIALLTSRHPAVDLRLSPRLRGERLDRALLYFATDRPSAAERKSEQSERTSESESRRERKWAKGGFLGSLLGAAAGTANAASGTMETKPLTNGNNGGYDVAGIFLERVLKALRRVQPARRHISGKTKQEHLKAVCKALGLTDRLHPVPEGHERLICRQRCSDLELVLVTGSWASSSGLPARSPQVTTRSTAQLKGTPGRRHRRPSTQQNIG
ncbi:hypothetical protein Baya_8612 [Bagarius yarrelli]|uniref:Uncharacterized protein n=1 Tax=Bagarius yarrelli TaxID=175774 RepID=A0A556U4G0_BAGYA|nr:hypothetical protein Baya_8612 [Bagarius yarrelli]